MKNNNSFKIAHEKLKDKFTQPQKHLPNNKIVQREDCKNIYIKVFDKSAINKNGKYGIYVVLAKIALDTYPIPSFDEFKRNYTTSAFKQDERFSISRQEYQDVIERVKAYSSIIRTIESESLHQSELLMLANKQYEISSLAMPIHELCDLIDKIESCSGEGVTVLEAQDIHQAIYRLTSRLNAAKLSNLYFYDYFFENDDIKNIEKIKNKNKFPMHSPEVIARYAKCGNKFMSLKPDIRMKKKENTSAVELRKNIEKFLAENNVPT